MTNRKSYKLKLVYTNGNITTLTVKFSDREKVRAVRNMKADKNIERFTIRAALTLQQQPQQA